MAAMAVAVSAVLAVCTVVYFRSRTKRAPSEDVEYSDPISKLLDSVWATRNDKEAIELLHFDMGEHPHDAGIL